MVSEVPGVEIHAEAFETMASRTFSGFGARRNRADGLRRHRDPRRIDLRATNRDGRRIRSARLLIAAAFWMPVLFFHHDIVFPFFAPVAVAWMSTMGAAVYQHFFVRRASAPVRIREVALSAGDSLGRA